MQASHIKIGIITCTVILLAAIVYVLFSGMGRPAASGLETYARGEMSGFRTLDDAPPRPSHTFIDPEGVERTLADFEGQVILVNYWATWCAPCIVEMPALDELQARYGGDDFQVVTISADRRIELAEQFFQENGLENLPVYHDNSFAGPTSVGARGLPISILYSRRGVEMGRMPRDAEWNSEDAHALIEAAIRTG
ncbi:TlpA disulfide reductase family protein [Hyphobacterium sp. HN65]|uniref:TlpA disulfide reductase family protein n=1 Tax=Hyphobacterium lacteum TaxID=3116575 RepID=A0ABU7LQ28_9PROT|nr:TlpA disulfide reductase family protein [Hyphobacterium sp. HN65]MEE2526008.1 TlpA disulfide reductase family protein [Hyphobacterium sp. HN65]